MTDVDRGRLATLRRDEEQLFVDRHPRSAAMAAGRNHLLGGVPMAWMSRWPGAFPLVVDSAEGGRFVDVDGHAAEMTYSRVSPTLVIIDHTAVPDALRGRGVGQQLVQRAVEDARREGFRIIPLCPFAKSQFERHPEWRDVLST